MVLGIIFVNLTLVNLAHLMSTLGHSIFIYSRIPQLLELHGFFIQV